MDWIYMYLYVCVCALCVGVVVVVVVALRLCNILDVPDHDGQSVGDLCALVKGNEREQVNRSQDFPESSQNAHQSDYVFKFRMQSYF